ncbi:hypothetical protein GCM10011609_67510 [Lentzea pudingi]|uniref:Gram-positive cocci surface proteins LPxTG domain-containing protein n=1 Tax=Lentzea pudingi TaxID=1789439 RepID=A0ABQ2IPJ0_9PSEU|nr:hypothetical protein [Lentzea pudingi]GGN17146.1 hypothetical protein GCM10011609_67510 [Lentzea pudingi]
MKATRLLPALAVTAALALAPGLALADPGNGKGNGITGNPSVPPGQSRKDVAVPQSQPQPKAGLDLLPLGLAGLLLVGGGGAAVVMAGQSRRP